MQMPSLKSPEQARRLIDYWAGEGATSFKAYMNISHDALGAAIVERIGTGSRLRGISVRWDLPKLRSWGLMIWNIGIDYRHGIRAGEET